MKILLLADAISSHTLKWVKSLHDSGFTLALISLYPKIEPGLKLFIEKNNILFYPGNEDFKGSFFSYLYVKKIIQTRSVIQSFKPDIVHAHYASSYGLLGALSGFRDLVISVWGSDVFQFPHERFYTKFILKYNLSKAKVICSTSDFMAKETKKYTKTKIYTIPFGVQLNKFEFVNRNTKNGPIVIGAIKSLEYIYGTDLLLKVFVKLLKETEVDIKLLLIGEGTLRPFLESEIAKLKIGKLVELRGYVGHDNVQSCYKEIDIFTSFSKTRESFGVSLIEAQATGLPIVVTPAGGFVEIIKNDNEGYIIDAQELNQIVDKLKKLVENKQARLSMGLNGFRKVKTHYQWHNCVDMQIDVYNNLLNK